MKQQIAEIIENKNIARSIWQMRIRFLEAFDVKAGQFVQISLPGRFLRRPISICDMDGDVMTIVYKVVGGGTDQMTKLAEGEQLDVLKYRGKCAVIALLAVFTDVHAVQQYFALGRLIQPQQQLYEC